MSKPAEILIFEFLSDRIAAAAADSPLAQLELHDTVYQKITRPRGVRISEAIGDLFPGPGMVLDEFDATVIITCFSRIEGKDVKARQPALSDVFEIQKAVTQEFVNDSTLGGRVCDSLTRKSSRGYDSYDEGVFAVTNTPLVINPRELGR